MPQEQLAEQTLSLGKSKGRSTIAKVQNTQTEELIIGLCYPLGAHRTIVIEALKNQLQSEYGYDSIEVIKLSKYILEHSKIKFKEENKTEAFQTYMTKIKGGDELRKHHNLDSILGDLAIKQIHNNRLNAAPKDKDGNPILEDIESRRICFIIDSIKNKAELSLFRSIYKDNFYLLSIYTPEPERRRLLSAMGDNEIDEILKIDNKENFTYGQNVSGTFIDADYFLRVSNPHGEEELERNEKFQKLINDKILRFLDLIFEARVITPDKNESAMYLAKSAAGNSSCLSRQVGACLTDKNGEVLSEGWNEVPKYNGNVYDNSSQKDRRCFILGNCSNDTTKDEITDEIVKYLLNDKDLKETLSPLKIINALKKNIRNSKISDLIEYSRSVHAEMNAIIKGAQNTADRMKGGKLFCTTYPCHNCARHIVFAGISEVYYIEPYTKSYATHLHKDSITDDEDVKDKVKILFYDGVAPRRYLQFFSNLNERKNNGILAKKLRKDLKPKTMISLKALSTLEQQAIHSLNEKEL